MESNPLAQLYASESSLIQHIYQCVDSPESWYFFMQQLVGSLDARSSRMLVLNEQANQVHKSISVNHDASFLQQYTEYYVNKCPWRPELAHKPPGRLYSSFLDFSCKQQAFRQTEFYNDWAKKQNIEHGICGSVFKGQGKTVQLLVQRTEQAGHFTREETTFVNRLVPHIQNAIKLSTSKDAMSAQKNGIKSLSGRYSQPFALVDENMTICFISETMETKVLESKGLSIKADKLMANNADESAQLNKLLAECKLTAAGLGHSPGGTIAISADKNDNLQLRVMPLPLEADNSFIHSKFAFSVIWLACSSLKFSLAKAQLALQYHLTERECQLASLLCKGLSVEELASYNGVKIGTLRKQLKSIYAKTNTHRQAELVALLLNDFAATRG